MNFELDAPYLEIQRQARDFARAIDPVAVEADEMSEIHPVVLAALRESGLSDLMVPAEYGGRTERLDPMAICVVREVLMATSAHADSMFALQGIGSYAITVAGTAQQREKWLPKVARAEALPALALTEPDAGSDLKSVTTELVPGGGGLLLNAVRI
jgi:acyl-CoA dehydrogenase